MAVLAAYGNFISNTPQVITLGGSVNLNANLPEAPVGMTFTPNTPAVTLLNAGVYHIDYRILTTLGVGASMVLLLNGAAVDNSDVTALVATGVGVTLAAGTNAFLNIIQIA